MLIYKNPRLIIEPIDAEYYACVNPLIKNGMKIITSIQKNILDLFDKNIDFNELCKLTGYEEEKIKKYIEILASKNILNTSGMFEHEKRSKNPKSLNLRIHTTDKCNLRCTYCYIKTKKTFEDMNDDTIDVLLDNIIETVKINGLKTVTLMMSGGEPTILFQKRENKILQLKKNLECVDCKLRISFLTNGTIINDDQIEYIKKNGFGLAISLDGIGKYHDKNRVYINGKGSFGQVSEKINRIIEKGLKPNIMTVVSNDNLDGLVELTEFLISKNLPFRYSFVQGAEIDQQKLLEVMLQCYEIIDKAIENGYKFSQLHRLCDLKFLNPYFQTCICGFSGGAIYLDGGVHFCHVKFGEKENNGNIRENKDILNLISKGKNNLSDLSEDCKNCNHEYICTGGCPIERKDGKDPHCEIYKVLIPKVYQLMGKERLLKILSSNGQ
ncbi:MAG: radical SAM protein [Candidatus Absconditabacterales bacterium]